jgi:hypothetical protein
MNGLFFTGVAAWAMLVAIVLAMAFYRLAITRGDYTVLHVRPSEMSLIPDQVRQNYRLNRIDWWGQVFTVVALVIGLALATVYLYNVLVRATQL